MIKLKGQINCQTKDSGKIVLAADLGGTNLRMATINNQGEILYRIKRTTPKTNKTEQIVQAIVELTEECRIASRKQGNVAAIAIAVPGTVDVKKGIIMTAPNLLALGGIRLATILEKELDLACILENDANAAAIGENWIGASKGFQSSICITLGTGVGGGIIIDGKVLRGVDGTAGEIGHICVEPDGVVCGCGSRGCVEQYSSATAIVRISNELISQYPKSNLIRNSVVDSLGIYKAAKKGDELALEVFRQQGFYLGIALAGLINVLNPEAIIIGGGVAAAWDLFIPHTIEQIHKRAYREPANRAKIIPARLGDDAGILGVARLAFENTLVGS